MPSTEKKIGIYGLDIRRSNDTRITNTSVRPIEFYDKVSFRDNTSKYLSTKLPNLDYMAIRIDSRYNNAISMPSTKLKTLKITWKRDGDSFDELIAGTLIVFITTKNSRGRFVLRGCCKYYCSDYESEASMVQDRYELRDLQSVSLRKSLSVKEALSESYDFIDLQCASVDNLRIARLKLSEEEYHTLISVPSILSLHR